MWNCSSQSKEQKNSRRCGACGWLLIAMIIIVLVAGIIFSAMFIFDDDDDDDDNVGFLSLNW
jgi:ATP/ADP translocase